MNREAIYHRTYSEYSFATAPDRVVVRLRAARGDLSECWVCYGDRMDPNSPIAITRAQMEPVCSDSLFDYYEAVFDPGVTRLCYYFELKKGSEITYYYNDGFFQVPDENRQLYYNFHYIRKEDMADVPEWFHHAVIYQIYPDSFATSKGFISGLPCRIEKSGQTYSSYHGGTLNGIRENIPYLLQLGINCIYLTPIFAANSWHKYDTVDYFEIDPCFGSKDDFRTLVESCHANGIRIILDGVFNHCGPGFFAFQDLLQNGTSSPYAEWFYPKGFPLEVSATPNYECFAYVASMPKLNTGNLETAQYLIDVGTYWIREFGIDGWRLDVANEIDHGFWRKFRQAIRTENPEAILIAEVWDDARSFLEGDQFDSAMNYNLTFAITDCLAKERISPQDLIERTSYLRMRYQEPIAQAQMNLIDSHDVPRFLTQAGGSVQKLKLALLFLMTQPGVPCIFYGDELGLAGWHEIEYRRCMEWNGGDSELFEYYHNVIQLRKQYNNAIQRGNHLILADNQCLIYYCTDDVGGILLALNMSPNLQSRSFRLPEGIVVDGLPPTDLLSGREFCIDGEYLHLDLDSGCAAAIRIQLKLG